CPDRVQNSLPYQNNPDRNNNSPNFLLKKPTTPYRLTPEAHLDCIEIFLAKANFRHILPIRFFEANYPVIPGSGVSLSGRNIRQKWYQILREPNCTIIVL